MKKLVLAAPVLLALVVGCSASADPAAESSVSDLNLDAQRCDAPVLNSASLTDSSGQTIEGSARATLDACVLGKGSESGTDVIARVTTLLGDTQSIGQIKNDDGSAVFSSFRPGGISGSLETGLVQDIEVELNEDFSPEATIRVTRRLNADGSYSLSMVNVTPFEASILFFPIDVIKAGNLSLDVTIRPESNGISVTGSSQVQLEEQKEEAVESARLVGDIFEWLKEELAK